MPLKTTPEQRARWRDAHKYDSLQETHDFYPDGVVALLDDVETLLRVLERIGAISNACMASGPSHQHICARDMGEVAIHYARMGRTTTTTD